MARLPIEPPLTRLSIRAMCRGMIPDEFSQIFSPLPLPCGVVLKNRLVKSAMSDSLGDGRGNPTEVQIRLYERWAEGGVAASIIGEVQGDPMFAEKPGNLVLREGSDLARFEALAHAGRANAALLWPQLGHAGAMAYPPISTPKGPSALDIEGLTCTALTLSEVQALPDHFARTALRAKTCGFGGVQIHAAHGFLLSQFLSPLFNKRGDSYGGTIENRMRLLLEVIAGVRAAVGPDFPVAVKLNATDQLEGGLHAQDALQVVAALDRTSIDLIDISGGTYFPGARSASDGTAKGAYFLDFAANARLRTTKPLMLTGGIKTAAEVAGILSEGTVDVVGLARALVLVPDLPDRWRSGLMDAPAFPRFTDPPEGAITAWYTMRLTDIGEDRDGTTDRSLDAAVQAYEARDRARIALWRAAFPK